MHRFLWLQGDILCACQTYFPMAEKGSPGLCRECRLRWATAKVGVKMYVWIMTQAVPRLWPACMLNFTDAPRLSFGSLVCVLSGFGVCMQIDCIVYVINVIRWHWDIRGCFVGLRSVDVRVCMLVAPPTEWACVALWLIPPLQRLDGIQHTQTHQAEYIMQTELRHKSQIFQPG